MNEKDSKTTIDNTEVNKTNNTAEKPPQKRTFSIFKNNKKPQIQQIQITKPKVVFHFGTGCNFPSYMDPKAPFCIIKSN